MQEFVEDAESAVAEVSELFAEKERELLNKQLVRLADAVNSKESGQTVADLCLNIRSLVYEYKRLNSTVHALTTTQRMALIQSL